MTTEHHHPLTVPEKFDLLREEINCEQEHYWTRFSGFATLHAGLLVLVTSDTIKQPKFLYCVAMFLGLLWFYVQFASLFYVNRLKPQFREVCEQRGFRYPSHPIFSRRFLSTTDMALIVPVALMALWIVLFFRSV
jgi:hypothetical protein